MPITKSKRSVVDRWLREPLLHFVLIGFALFAGYAALNPGGDRPDSASRIVITGEDLKQIELAWTAQWRRRPTAAELRSLIDAKVREEILYREALALGLDRDDIIVKRRLAQKMAFVAEDVSAIRDPGREELKTWYENHRQRFALPGLVSFRHVYFSPDTRGARAREGAERALERLAGKSVDVPAAAHVGDRFMFQDYYGDSPAEVLARVFGSPFAQALLEVKPGIWQGPLESGLGWHLVFVASVTTTRVPAFEEIEADVKNAWMDERRGEARSRAFEAMKARYEVVLLTP